MTHQRGAEWGLSYFHLQTGGSADCGGGGALTRGLAGQTGPADVGQQVVDVGGGLHVLRVHRRLRGSDRGAVLHVMAGGKTASKTAPFPVGVGRL